MSTLKDEGTVQSMGAKLLTPELREQILEKQRECTLIWNTRDGNSTGTMVSYIWHKGSIWTSAVKGMQPRLAAIRRNANVSIVVSVMGTGLGRDRCISMRGTCTIHDTPAVREELTPLFCRKLGTGNLDERIKGMDTPGIVWLEIKPEHLFTADFNDQMTAALALDALEPSEI